MNSNGNGQHPDDGVLRISTLVKRGRPVEVLLRDPDDPENEEKARLFNTFMAHRSNFGADDWGEMFDQFARMEELDQERAKLALAKADDKDKWKRSRAFNEEATELTRWLIGRVLPRLEPEYIAWLDDESQLAVVNAFFEDVGMSMAQLPTTPTPRNRQQRRQAPRKPTGAKSSPASSSTTEKSLVAGGGSRRES